MSDQDDDQTDHDPTPASILIESLFPVDSATWCARLLGLQKRSVDRMISGYSTVSPALLEKLAAQADIRDKMMAEIEATIAKAEAEGGHMTVLRYALTNLIRGTKLDRDHEPL